MAHRAPFPAREADREIRARARVFVAVERGGTLGSKGLTSFDGHSPYGCAGGIDERGGAVGWRILCGMVNKTLQSTSALHDPNSPQAFNEVDPQCLTG